MKTVWIYGTARNLGRTPVPPKDVEVWVANSPLDYFQRLPRIPHTREWTRWFNLHSREWMEFKYPTGFSYYQQQDGSKPIYTQRYWDDLPGCSVFPAKDLQQFFATEKGPIRYFTCSVNWMAPFAYMEGFRRIQFWGFALADTKPNGRWIPERACWWYWINRLRGLGCEITYPPEVESIPNVPGDPDAYDGPVYGYQTKPEEPPVIVHGYTDH